MVRMTASELYEIMDMVHHVLQQRQLARKSELNAEQVADEILARVRQEPLDKNKIYKAIQRLIEDKKITVHPIDGKLTVYIPRSMR
ncbi:hypothetical protein JF634_04530 [Simonsiella muelleri]|uniref:Uncharacterized protein n=2 Tax=Simonsiella TaxID=71 RepID=V9HE69_9NEIS|nr:hypothetical protein [Simonsiella muelleri]AUX60426.1 hypothetical protein BWP33_00300 [Simonsiella muelleri ATCC 29453]EFG32052.1 hypothetical protein HMPREF9021_00457 [Simonsiella muelleri ATCC 29453]UBQ54750.1 hypothetical protein JF634_04530 [Simonsiella muelleri]